jgi:hypothetical protein
MSTVLRHACPHSPLAPARVRAGIGPLAAASAAYRGAGSLRPRARRRPSGRARTPSPAAAPSAVIAAVPVSRPGDAGLLPRHPAGRCRHPFAEPGRRTGEPLLPVRRQGPARRDRGRHRHASATQSALENTGYDWQLGSGCRCSPIRATPSRTGTAITTAPTTLLFGRTGAVLARWNGYVLERCRGPGDRLRAVSLRKSQTDGLDSPCPVIRASARLLRQRTLALTRRRSDDRRGHAGSPPRSRPRPPPARRTTWTAPPRPTGPAPSRARGTRPRP